MATQPDNPTAPGHSACLKGLLACIEVRPVSLSAENVGAGRSAEDNGTNHKRKAESLSISTSEIPVGMSRIPSNSTRRKSAVSYLRLLCPGTLTL